MAVKHEKCLIRQVCEDDNGAVRALVEFDDGRTKQLRVTFPRLLKWRLEKDDEAISLALSALECSVWIDDDTFVKIRIRKQVTEATDEESARESSDAQITSCKASTQRTRPHSGEQDDEHDASAKTEERDMRRREHTKSLTYSVRKGCSWHGKPALRLADHVPKMSESPL